MSNISDKISSIEPEDTGVLKSLGLHPTDEPVSSKVKDTPPDDPIPSFISRPSGFPDYRVEKETSLWAKIFPVTASIIWIFGALLLIHVFFNLNEAGSSLSPAELTALAFLVIGPACLVFITIVALQKLSELSRLSAHLGHTTELLMTPDASVARKTKDMANAIQDHVSNLNSDIDIAISRVHTLGEVLTEQSDRLGKSSYATEEKTKLIADRLSTEREALQSITSTFDERMKALSEVLDSNSDKLAQSTQMAEQKIEEARVSVEGAAEKINSASEIVRSKTIEASETLEANHTQLVGLGDNLKSRAETLDSVFSKHVDDLKGMVSSLRSDQESLSLALEEQVNKMRDMSLSAQVSSERLFEASAAGKDTVQALSEAAQLTDSAVRKRFSEMEDMVKYSTSKAENISEKAARRVQESLSHTRKEIARIEDDMKALQEKLQQTTFDAPEDVEISSEPEKSAVDEVSDVAEPEIQAEEAETLEPVLRRDRKSIKVMPIEDTDDDTLDLTEAIAEELKAVEDAATELEEDLPLDLTDSAVTGLRDSEDDIDFEIPDPEMLDVPDIEVPSMDIDITEPELESEPVIDPEEDVRDDDADILRRTIPDIRTSPDPDEPKRPWWKSLIPGRDDGSNTAAIDRITTREPAENHEGDIILTLAHMGLAPGVIIDDGCVIEATDVRLSDGANAMSTAVAKRLGDPVAHLQDAISKDEALKLQLSKFAARYHLTLEALDKDRDILRAKLEKDDGRAFLICDAALNT